MKAYLSWLRLARNSYDEAALRTASQAPRSGIGPATWQKLSQTANAADYSVTTVLNEIHHQPAAYPDANIRPQELKAIAGFCERLHNLWDLTDSRTPHQLLIHLRDQTGLGRWTEGLHNTTDRKVNIADLFNMADENRYPQGSLSQFLEDIATSAAEAHAGDRNLPRVTLTTLHQAKGLEFPHVLIAGAEAGLLPHRMSQTPSEQEEERRLFYVGITRAEDSLTVSWCRKRNNRPAKPSPFLSQIDPDCWHQPLPNPGPADGKHAETDAEPTAANISDTANQLAEALHIAVKSLQTRPDLSERLTATARICWPAIKQSPNSRSPESLAQALTASQDLAKLLSSAADDAPGDVRSLTEAHRLCVTLSRYYRQLAEPNGAHRQ